jgi:hypothetical protein
LPFPHRFLRIVDRSLEKLENWSFLYVLIASPSLSFALSTATLQEIPDEITPPGALRSQYKGHAKVEALVADANGRIDEVRMSAALSSPTESRARPPMNPMDPRPVDQDQAAMASGPAVWASEPIPPAGPSPNYLGNIQGLDTGFALEAQDRSAIGPSEVPSYPYQDGPARGQMRRSVDDFGVTNVSSGAGGGRFVTFPVKNNRATGPGSGLPHSENFLPPVGYHNSRHQQSDSFSSSVVTAMGSEDPFSPGHQPTNSNDYPTRMRRSLDGETNPLAYVPPLGRLPGNPWNDTDTNEGSSTEEPQLAYMRDPLGTVQLFDRPGPSDNQGGDSPRNARFGGAGSVNAETGSPRQRDQVSDGAIRGKDIALIWVVTVLKAKYLLSNIHR